MDVKNYRLPGNNGGGGDNGDEEQKPDAGR
ncbi:hypothetical protein PNC201_13300 [Pseudoalteromonas sp. NC201]|nr:hypothetical protein PNC201_13300 [Pseudoalteromonas sp. NC201]